MHAPLPILFLSCLLILAHGARAQDESTDDLRAAKSVVSRYCDAWGKTDPAERKSAVSGVWAENGEYLDSQPVRVSGREALESEILKFQQQFPGAGFRCTAVRAHHGFVGYTWTMVGPDGTTLMQGMDFGELDSSGQLVRIVSFFDMPPSPQP